MLCSALNERPSKFPIENIYISPSGTVNLFKLAPIKCNIFHKNRDLPRFQLRAAFVSILLIAFRSDAKFAKWNGSLILIDEIYV